MLAPEPPPGAERQPNIMYIPRRHFQAIDQTDTAFKEPPPTLADPGELNAEETAHLDSLRGGDGQVNPERFPGFVSIVSAAVRPANPPAGALDPDDERAASFAHGWIPKGASGWCYDGYYDNISGECCLATNGHA